MSTKGRIALQKLFGFALRPVVRLRGRVLGQGEARIGRNIICGDARLIEQTRSGLLLLQGYDFQIASEILFTGWLVHSSGKRPRWNIDRRVFGLSDRWLEWGEHGIIANFLFMQNLLKRPQWRDSDQFRAAQETTADWLEGRKFPEEIVRTLRRE